MKHALQMSDALEEQPARTSDAASGVADLAGFPLRLSAEHMQRIFGYQKSRFYELLERGCFDVFELRPTIGHRAWSRELVARYLRGEFIGPVSLRHRR